MGLQPLHTQNENLGEFNIRLVVYFDSYGGRYTVTAYPTDNKGKELINEKFTQTLVRYQRQSDKKLRLAISILNENLESYIKSFEKSILNKLNQTNYKGKQPR